MLKKIVLTAALVSAPISSATARTAKCLMEYQGNTYIEGSCDFEPGEGGSFDLRQGYWWITLEIVDKGFANGLWNPDGSSEYGAKQVPSLRQHGYLGYLRRDEKDAACWVNWEAKVCAW